MGHLSSKDYPHCISQHGHYINLQLFSAQLTTLAQFHYAVGIPIILPPPSPQFSSIFPSLCPNNPLCHPQEEKYLQTFPIIKTAWCRECWLAAAFLVAACWLKPTANSMGHHIVQFTWLLLLSPALCLCSRASSLLPATAQANNAPAGQEFSTSYKCLQSVSSSCRRPQTVPGEASCFCHGSHQRRGLHSCP